MFENFRSRKTNYVLPHTPAIKYLSRTPIDLLTGECGLPFSAQTEINIKVDDWITLLSGIASHQPLKLEQLPKLTTMVSFSTKKFDS